MRGCIQPMSSPIMKRMLGFCCCCAEAEVAKVVTATNSAIRPSKNVLVIPRSFLRWCFLNRDSPDESPTGVDIRGFPAFLQDGRAVWIDAVTAATWTGVEGADMATSLAFGHTPAVGLLERMGY